MKSSYSSLAAPLHRVALFASRVSCGRARPQRNPRPFPILSGLEEAVGFWKQVFTRYGADQIVLFDPMDPGKIYSVVRAADGACD